MKMKENPSLYLSTEDHQVITLLLRSIKFPQGSALKLKEELSRAIVLGDSQVPSDSVGLNSKVELEDLDLGEVETYELSLPSRANPDLNRVSILAPLGVALLGVRAGEDFVWNTPGGLRRLRVVRVTRESKKASVHGPYSLV
ncbi:GreA/GreB family elongation factor [Pelagicoccus sp. SDUM812005]|uniref:GreA/GreB family elongation factor n=1 Tax=Pelagicoccus sp. SDUM812005 TaxID=3041257 RepID=UPI0028100D5D|nr:GreA/GreB family elongation factor [Pelagicoccus sp. SDUM812005]MDQ8183120.1 GreA/GreB family elongation factor [Pelagicoccus sp. SDUM812005]